MQKLIAFLLSILLVFSLCSCKGAITDTPPSPDTLPTGNTPLIEEKGEEENQEKQQTQPNTPQDKKPEKENESSPEVTAPEKPQENEQTQTPDTQPQTPQSPSVTEPEISDINEIVANHTALQKEQYYQYSFLNDTEKVVYNEFYSAAEKCQNILDLTKYNLTGTNVKKIYAAFTADCPQYFYISKYCTYIINSTTETVTQFLLQYTDGTVTDKFDDNNKPIHLADRKKINSQIIEFGNKINAILSYIPSNISELERERKIYEYITDTVIYDNTAEEASENDPNYISFSFSAYGAACKGMAVCEGYVKLFQYLCYNSGINATPVESDETMQHMWAAVNIDNNWYMTDITWDDTDNEFICTYKYFNVTTLYLSSDHSFGSSLKVPLADSDKASFYNNFALIPKDNTPPQNYKEIINAAVNNSDKYLYVYRGDSSADLNDFINEEIYYGEIGEYIKSLGLTIGDEYYHTNSYYFIPISKQQAQQ